jgi:uncharacterized delta-60 repeat protein
MAVILHLNCLVYAVQPDGKLYAGYRTDINAFTSTLYRLNPDGSIDNTFSMPPVSGSTKGFSQVTILSDGKLMIGGAHSYGTLFRVNSNGTQDLTFSAPVLVLTSGPMIHAFFIEGDGKITLRGDFTSVNGLDRKYIARLNSHASVDTQFVPAAQLFSPPIGLERLTSGKYILGGNLSGSGSFVRLNQDGTTDNSFTPSVAIVPKSWHLDPHERVIQYGRNNGLPGYVIGRLNTDGTTNCS